MRQGIVYYTTSVQCHSNVTLRLCCNSVIAMLNWFKSVVINGCVILLSWLYHLLSSFPGDDMTSPTLRTISNMYACGIIKVLDQHVNT